MSAVTDADPHRPRWALLTLVLVAALLWHALSLWVPERPKPPAGAVGRDYASYHYAARVAMQGGDPYDAGALERAAAEEGVRRTRVHPFLYPPPAVLLFVGANAVDLETGLSLWRGVVELALLGALGLLVVWWSPLGSTRVLALLAVGLALMSGVAYGHHLGQANAVVLFLTVAGLVLADRRPLEGGAILGLAITIKLAPALFVGLLLLDRRFKAVGGVVAGALAASVASLAVVGAAGQASFYGRVLPGLAQGDYNGLQIQIGMFANHSFPNLVHQVLPGGSGLSAGGQVAAGLMAVCLILVLGAAFRTPAADPLTRAARFSAVAVTLLLIPTYTFDHHLIWALPGIALVAVAIAEERLPIWAVVPAGFAAAVLCFPSPPLKRLHTFLEGGFDALLVQEAKHLGLWSLWALCVWAGLSRPNAR